MASEVSLETAIAACLRPDPAALRVMLETSPSLAHMEDGAGNTLLHHASRSGYRGLCYSLVSGHNAAPHRQNKDHRTPLQVARLAGFDDMCTILHPDIFIETKLDSPSCQEQSSSGPGPVHYSGHPDEANARFLTETFERLNLESPDRIADIVKSCVLVEVLAGQAVTVDFKPAPGCFVVDSGSFTVSHRGVEIGKLSRGSIFEDSGLLQTEMHLAFSVTAVTDGRLWMHAYPNVSSRPCGNFVVSDIVAGGPSRQGWWRKIPFRRKSTKVNRKSPVVSTSAPIPNVTITPPEVASPDAMRRRNKNRQRSQSSSSGMLKGLSNRKPDEDVHPKHHTTVVARATVDMVMKMSTKNHQLFLSAASFEKLIQYLIEEGKEDRTFTRNFFLCYRDFATPMDVFSALRHQHEVTQDADRRDTILWLLSCWTSRDPIPVDPPLSEQTEGDVVAAMQQFAIDAQCDKKSRAAKVLLANLQPPKVKGSVIGFWPDARTSSSIRVYITKPENLLEFETTAKTTLGDILKLVHEHHNQQALDSRSRQPINFDPNAYQFRAMGWSTVLELSLYVMDVGLRDVLLTPLKAYSAGGCVADYLNADFIAKTLTYLDFDTFSRVSHHEFFNKHYQKNTGHAPYTAALAQRSNKISDWAINLVLGERSEWERKKVIVKLIEVANICSNVSNYLGVFQIISALRSPAVFRLRKTWADVDSVNIALFRCLERVSTDPADNRASYRYLLKNIGKEMRPCDHSLDEFALREPCLPVLTTFLLDIIYGEEGNPAKVPSWRARGLEAPGGPEDLQELINFQRYRYIGQVIADVRMFQTNEITLSDDGKVKDNLAFSKYFVEMRIPHVEDEQQYEKSMLLEPRQRSEPTTPPAGPSKNFMYKTINATYDAASAESTENESCSLEIDAWNIRYQDRSSQMIDFLGSFQCKNEKSIRQQFFKFMTTQKRSKKKSGHNVTVDIRNDEVTVTDRGTMDILIRRHLKDITSYRYEPEHNVFFFVVEDYTSHVFQSQLYEAEELFMRFYRAMNKFSRNSVQASNAARREALAHLAQDDRPIGSFVLRDSTSQPGSYALSLKHTAGVDHFLINTLPNKKVAMKNATVEFDDLESLIIAYCQKRCGLPVPLNLQGSIFLTTACSRPATNMLSSTLTSEEQVFATERPWLMRNLTREHAERLLRECGEEGAYLVRESSSGKPGSFALSFKQGGHVLHVLIVSERGYFSINDKPCGNTLEAVIEACKSNSKELLPAQLTVPCPSPTSLDLFSSSIGSKPQYKGVAVETIQAVLQNRGRARGFSAPAPVENQVPFNPVRRIGLTPPGSMGHGGGASAGVGEGLTPRSPILLGVEDPAMDTTRLAPPSIGVQKLQSEEACQDALSPRSASPDSSVVATLTAPIAAPALILTAAPSITYTDI